MSRLVAKGPDLRERRCRLRPGQRVRLGRHPAISARERMEPFVSELLPDAKGEDALSDEAVAQYESALDAFVSGDWDTAFAGLHEVPHWDHGKDFLTSHILKHQRTPPSDWDGVVTMESK